MKKYNVALAAGAGIFDYHDGFESARDAVEFATGRGGTYKVHIDAGKADDGEWISATHHGNEAFTVDIDGWGTTKWFSVDALAKYVEKNL